MSLLALSSLIYKIVGLKRMTSHVCLILKLWLCSFEHEPAIFALLGIFMGCLGMWFYFLKIYSLLLERQIRFMEERRDKEKDLSSGLFPKWLQWPELSWYEARSQEQASSTWMQGPQSFGYPLLLSQALSRGLNGEVEQPERELWYPYGIPAPVWWWF